MEKEQLRNLLRQPYKTENWKQISSMVFPHVSYLAQPKSIPHQNKNVNAFRQIGEVRLNDGKNLAMFEVTVAENVNIARNKVELRKLVAPYIDQEKNHGVLVIYEQGKENYRFTFTAKSSTFDETDGSLVTVETDAKRFTYVLGQGETCRTATSRLWELKDKKDNATIKDVEEAFSVERLNKEFFDKYKEFYETFVLFITGKRFIKEKGKWVEKTVGKAHSLHKTVFNSDDKTARNFVKLLLGRLVFIQFLQKKGWMGVPLNKNWGEGDKEFLTHLFANTKDKDRFHSKTLWPLFYEAFNSPHRDNDLFKITQSRIPYLNGGLFENDYPKSDQIDFPKEYFSDLMEFFTQFNFTIDENDPLDHEVGIDPEMLGNIFENLLEDNKDKGAFYTPKVIVQFMCQESLLEYLKTYFKAEGIWPTNENEQNKIENSLGEFVRKKRGAGVIDYDRYIAMALKSVKICDPAIGSGAFPMGLLNEIFTCVQVLHEVSPDEVGAVWNIDNWDAAAVKKNIIQNSIYGVDLEKGAVDIARLRFWLSLVVDEDEPYPLPNLDFKIMQGNSLLEKFEDIDLSSVHLHQPNSKEPERNLFGEFVNAQLTFSDNEFLKGQALQAQLKSFFSESDPSIKARLKEEINRIVHSHIDYNLNLALSSINSQLSTAPKLSDKTMKSSVRKKVEALHAKKEYWEKAKKRLHEIQNTVEKPFFLWHLYFNDVYAAGGFDIVIGNPPYVQLQKMDQAADDLSSAGYSTFVRTGDLYCLFYEKGFSLLKDGGTLAYITSNKWMRAAYGEELRKYFIEKTNPILLVDFGGYQVFDATVDTNILISRKETYQNSTKTCVLGTKFKSLNYLSDYFRQHNSATAFELKRSWVILNETAREIKKKIESIGTELKNWDIAIYRGILTGFNEAFIVSEQTRGELIKSSSKNAEIIRPILRGRDIQKFHADWQHIYLITTHTGYQDISGKQVPPVNLEDYPSVKEHLDQYWQNLHDRLDQGTTPYHLRSCIYMDDFFKPKIIYPEITKFLGFFFDETEHYYVNNKCFILTGVHLQYLTAFLNSSLFKFCFIDNFPELLGGTRELRKIFLEKIPVKKISDEQNQEFSKQLSLLRNLKSKGKSTIELERLLDKMIFDVYELTEAERKAIGFIEIK